MKKKYLIYLLTLVMALSPVAVFADVEADAEAVNGICAKLKVVEIPEEATDWEINEYDGLESITYVVDGKLHHIS